MVTITILVSTMRYSTGYLKGRVGASADPWLLRRAAGSGQCLALAHWILVHHPPAPALLGEEPRGHLADRAEVVDASVDRVRIYGPTVAT
jgi:hypothetical protein